MEPIMGDMYDKCCFMPRLKRPTNVSDNNQLIIMTTNYNQVMSKDQQSVIYVSKMKCQNRNREKLRVEKNLTIINSETLNDDSSHSSHSSHFSISVSSCNERQSKLMKNLVSTLLYLCILIIFNKSLIRATSTTRHQSPQKAPSVPKSNYFILPSSISSMSSMMTSNDPLVAISSSLLPSIASPEVNSDSSSNSPQDIVSPKSTQQKFQARSDQITVASNLIGEPGRESSQTSHSWIQNNNNNVLFDDETSNNDSSTVSIVPSTKQLPIDTHQRQSDANKKQIKISEDLDNTDNFKPITNDSANGSNDGSNNNVYNNNSDMGDPTTTTTTTTTTKQPPLSTFVTGDGFTETNSHALMNDNIREYQQQVSASQSGKQNSYSSRNNKQEKSTSRRNDNHLNNYQPINNDNNNNNDNNLITDDQTQSSPSNDQGEIPLRHHSSSNQPSMYSSDIYSDLTRNNRQKQYHAGPLYHYQLVNLDQHQQVSRPSAQIDAFNDGARLESTKGIHGQSIVTSHPQLRNKQQQSVIIMNRQRKGQNKQQQMMRNKQRQQLYQQQQQQQFFGPTSHIAPQSVGAPYMYREAINLANYRNNHNKAVSFYDQQQPDDHYSPNGLINHQQSSFIQVPQVLHPTLMAGASDYYINGAKLPRRYRRRPARLPPHTSSHIPVPVTIDSHYPSTTLGTHNQLANDIVKPLTAIPSPTGFIPVVAVSVTRTSPAPDNARQQQQLTGNSLEDEQVTPPPQQDDHVNKRTGLYDTNNSNNNNNNNNQRHRSKDSVASSMNAIDNDRQQLLAIEDVKASTVGSNLNKGSDQTIKSAVFGYIPSSGPSSAALVRDASPALISNLAADTGLQSHHQYHDNVNNHVVGDDLSQESPTVAIQQQQQPMPILMEEYLHPFGGGFQTVPTQVADLNRVSILMKSPSNNNKVKPLPSQAMSPMIYHYTNDIYHPFAMNPRPQTTSLLPSHQLPYLRRSSTLINKQPSSRQSMRSGYQAKRQSSINNNNYQDNSSMNKKRSGSSEFFSSAGHLLMAAIPLLLAPTLGFMFASGPVSGATSNGNNMFRSHLDPLDGQHSYPNRSYQSMSTSTRPPLSLVKSLLGADSDISDITTTTSMPTTYMPSLMRNVGTSIDVMNLNESGYNNNNNNNEFSDVNLQSINLDLSRLSSANSDTKSPPSQDHHTTYATLRASNRTTKDIQHAASNDNWSPILTKNHSSRYFASQGTYTQDYSKPITSSEVSLLNDNNVTRNMSSSPLDNKQNQSTRVKRDTINITNTSLDNIDDIKKILSSSSQEQQDKILSKPTTTTTIFASNDNNLQLDQDSQESKVKFDDILEEDASRRKPAHIITTMITQIDGTDSQQDSQRQQETLLKNHHNLPAYDMIDSDSDNDADNADRQSLDSKYRRSLMSPTTKTMITSPTHSVDQSVTSTLSNQKSTTSAGGVVLNEETRRALMNLGSLLIKDTLLLAQPKSSDDTTIQNTDNLHTTTSSSDDSDNITNRDVNSIKKKQSINNNNNKRKIATSESRKNSKKPTTMLISSKKLNVNKKTLKGSNINPDNDNSPDQHASRDRRNKLIKSHNITNGQYLDNEQDVVDIDNDGTTSRPKVLNNKQQQQTMIINKKSTATFNNGAINTNRNNNQHKKRRPVSHSKQLQIIRDQENLLPDSNDDSYTNQDDQELSHYRRNYQRNGVGGGGGGGGGSISNDNYNNNMIDNNDNSDGRSSSSNNNYDKEVNHDGYADGLPPNQGHNNDHRTGDSRYHYNNNRKSSPINDDNNNNNQDYLQSSPDRDHSHHKSRQHYNPRASQSARNEDTSIGSGHHHHHHHHHKSSNFRNRLDSEADTNLVRSKGDTKVVGDYLKHIQFSDQDRDKLMASYLTCDGLLNDNDHCLERLSCEFSDPVNIIKANKLDRAVSSILLGHILVNTYIPNPFKLRLKSASLFGYTQSGKCSQFACNKLMQTNHNKA